MVWPVIHPLWKLTQKTSFHGIFGMPQKKLFKAQEVESMWS